MPGQAEAEAEARGAVRARAQRLLTHGRPADAKADDSLPLNARLLQTTLGVTSEGFQVRPAGACLGACLVPGLAWPGLAWLRSS